MSGVSDACRKKQTCRGRASSERAGVFAVTKHVSRTIPAPCQPSLIRRPASAFPRARRPPSRRGGSNPPAACCNNASTRSFESPPFPTPAKQNAPAPHPPDRQNSKRRAAWGSNPQPLVYHAPKTNALPLRQPPGLELVVRPAVIITVGSHSLTSPVNAASRHHLGEQLGKTTVETPDRTGTRSSDQASA